MRWANSLEIKNLSEEKFKEVFGEKPKPGSGNGKNAKDEKEKKEVKKEEKKAVSKVVSEYR